MNVWRRSVGSPASPTRAELGRYFFLDDTDRALVAERRGEHLMLGLAVQLGTVRFLGTFLADPLDVPTAVVDYVALQLGIEDASCIKRYAERAKTPWDHQQEIGEVYGYTGFAGDQVRAGLTKFVSGRALTHAEGPWRPLRAATRLAGRYRDHGGTTSSTTYWSASGPVRPQLSAALSPAQELLATAKSCSDLPRAPCSRAHTAVLVSLSVVPGCEPASPRK